MRTYTHGLIGYLLYLRGTRRQQLLAVTGGMVPDLVLGIGYIPHFLEPRFPVPVVRDAHTLLHEGWLHGVTQTMHSVVLVGALTVAALFFLRAVVPLLVGMLAHGFVDLLTHGGFPYNHLYPFPVDPVLSPISYTDLWFTIMEHVALAVALAWLVARWRSGPASARPRTPEVWDGAGPLR